ncbi:hypothetical protein JMN32_25950 [Fulvivirga sp. 29W222]|uniref:PKD-like domain-containing protein n=1 Tax=Fulvivirga marina TaxID=2494733 RepID=A0A937G3T3_9BACT|nr:hypothetical protein [Fulvivirga marina]MBL6449781.1 hypothetical protein [Fulvivirga marina]
MKNKLSIFILSLITAVLFTACGDDDSTFNGPFRLNIAGSSEVRPESTHEYTIGDFTSADSYTWTVSGPATVSGSATGNTVSITFGEVGDVVITVTNGTDTGTFGVEVANTEPTVSVSYNGGGTLRTGEADTVFFEFDAPLALDPSFAMNTTDSTQFNGGTPFVSGSLGPLVKVDADSYYAIYTAGDGNGTSEALFQDIKSTATYGDVNIDSAFVKLYRVDNIAPVATIDYSPALAMDSTVITVTVTFSELVMAANPAVDSSLLISFANAGVATETDTLIATEDPLVYTYQYTLNGEGNGQVEVIVSNIADLAGNTSEISSYELVADNTAPGIDWYIDEFTGYAEVGFILLGMGPAEAGTGYYAVFPSGAAAPASLEEFENGVVSGTKQINAGTYVIYNVPLEAGNYNIYFIGEDLAGNMSPISSDSFTVN